MKKLILFGDSIMKGVTFNGSGYHLCPDHDLPQLAARGIEIENHTKMGATIGDGLRAMDKYLTGCDSQTTVLLGYGGNDCDYDWQAISDAPSADHSPKTAPDAYIEGMRRAIRKAQDAGAMVAVASLVPLDADRYLQFISKNRDGKNILSWLGDAAHLYRWQEYYNALTVQMARAFGCRLVDLRTAFLQSRNFLDLLCPDGIHPTDSGYALVHKTLSAAMDSPNQKAPLDCIKGPRSGGAAPEGIKAPDLLLHFARACRGRCRAQLFATKERYRCGLPLAGTHRPVPAAADSLPCVKGGGTAKP